MMPRMGHGFAKAGATVLRLNGEPRRFAADKRLPVRGDGYRGTWASVVQPMNRMILDCHRGA